MVKLDKHLNPKVDKKSAKGLPPGHYDVIWHKGKFVVVGEHGKRKH